MLKRIFFKNSKNHLPNEVINYIYKIRNLDRQTYFTKLREVLIRQHLIENEEDVNFEAFYEEEIDDDLDEDIEYSDEIKYRPDKPLHWDNVLRPQIITDFHVYRGIFTHRLDKEVKPFIEDINLSIDIKLRDALSRDKTFNITYTRIVPCTDCDTVSGNPCSFCKEEGNIEYADNTFLCKICMGKGKVLENKCMFCKNTRHIETKHKLVFKIGKEFHWNKTYTFKNLGNYDPIKKRYGNLKIITNIISDTDEKGLTLTMNEKEGLVEADEIVPVSKLVLGGAWKIKHERGETEIQIRENTQPGEYKVIDNVGVPKFFDEDEGTMQFGSQVVYFKVDVPDVGGNQELKRLYEELRKYDDRNEINELNHIKMSAGNKNKVSI
jgi:DnaJ-class molecular chaperone